MEKRLPFAVQLRHERERQSLSQEDVANKVNATPKTVGRWENGESQPRHYHRRALCELFGKTAEEFGLLDELEGYDPGSSQTEPSPVDEPPPAKQTGSAVPEYAGTFKSLDDAPHLENFYGREKEIRTLKGWLINQHCRVIAILGMGGIGKTSLTSHLVRQVEDQFESIYWQQLQNAPSLQLVLKQFLQRDISQQQIHGLDSIDDYISLLIHYLQNHRCLLILDNMESLLQGGGLAGRYREGYEDYRTLLQRVGETRHQSCILLTSREKPGEIALFESPDGPVQALHLQGIDLKGGQEILQDRGLFGLNQDWRTLIEHYSGNPLALKLVSEYIKSLFGGDIARFLHEEDLAFSDINDLLEQQFQRLPVQEQEVLFWLAIEREPVTLTHIRENLARPGTGGAALLDNLNSLRRRFLIETQGVAQFLLQPVIMEYITTTLVKRASQEFIEADTTAPFATWINFAFMQAEATEHVRESQVRFILQPIANGLLTILNQRDIEKKIASMLNSLRQIPAQQQGYAAGNILNLLILLKFDLRGRDFSKLTIRQAYLQGALLPELNFAHSQFISSIFTNTFGSIPSLKFSPSGLLLALGTSTGDVWIYQALKGTPLCICRGHTDGIWSLAFSSDERTLVSSSDDWTVRIWDSTTGTCLNTLVGHQNRVRTIAITPDDRLLVSGSDDTTVRLWDMQTGAYLRTLSEHADVGKTRDSRIWSVDVSSDGKLLATGSTDGSIHLWDTSTWNCQQTVLEHPGGIRSLAFQPGGTMLASGGNDNAIRLWDVATSKCLHTITGHSNRIWSLAFEPEGEILASGSEDRTIRLWEMSTCSCLKILTSHSNGVRSVCFKPGSTMLASGGEDQAVRLWDSQSGNNLQTFQGYTNRIWSLAFGPTRTMLVSVCEDQTLRLWDVDSGQPIRTIQARSHGARPVAFHPVSQLLASGGGDQMVRIWDAQTGQEIRKLQGHTNWVWAVAFSPTGELLASGSEDLSVRTWSLATGQGLQVMLGHTSWIRSVAFSPTDKLLASGSDDQTIKLWDTRTGKLLQTLKGHRNRVRCVAFSPDGTLLGSCSEDQTIRLWDIETGQSVSTLEGHSSLVRSISFSPDGRILASGGEDQTVRLWNVQTGQCNATLIGHNSRIRSVCFNIDGTMLASGSDDGTIIIWNPETEQVTREIRHELPYEHMNITGIQGLAAAQKDTLRILGAAPDLDS